MSQRRSSTGKELAFIVSRRNTFVLDSENNTMGLRSIVKILNSPIPALRNRSAEVKGFFKNHLFVWIREEYNNVQVLRNSNGYYAIDSKQVVLGGKEFLKGTQPTEAKGFVSGLLDRKLRDKKMKPYVLIASGEHKGLKGKVCFADENFVKVELLAKDIKVQLPRTAVKEIADPTKPLSYQGSGAIETNPMSFEEAG
jgi:hypothetical protein